MGMLERVAMRLMVKRLVAYGYAEPAEVGVDYETSAKFGRPAGAPTLLLTDAALYAGLTGQTAAMRILRTQVGRVLTTEVGRNVAYAVHDSDGNVWCQATFCNGRPSFRIEMARLHRELPPPTSG